MKKLTQDQLILLVDRLIDDAGNKNKSLYSADRFTGGAVITAYHYGKISYKADLYFGYGKSNNPIHCKMPIDELIAGYLFQAINEKCKSSLENETYGISLLDDIVSTSLRSRNDSVQRKDIDIDKKEKEEFLSKVDQVLTSLRLKTGKGFLTKSKATQDLLRCRFSDGYSVRDCKRVVWSKVKEWTGTDMEKYLIPSTLFRKSKFEKYHESLPIERVLNEQIEDPNMEVQQF